MGTIDEKLKKLENTKNEIKAAIQEKGQVVNDLDPFSIYPDKIRDIQTGINTEDANAIAEDILTGKTAYVKGNKITGNMPNKGNISQTLNAGTSYTIPRGYHEGAGTISAKTLIDQTPATAIASDIKTGKTAWVNGRKITGTLTASEIKTKNVIVTNKTSDVVWISYQDGEKNNFGTTYLDPKERVTISVLIGGWVFCYPENRTANGYGIALGKNLGPGGAIEGNTVGVDESTTNLNIVYY